MNLRLIIWFVPLIGTGTSLLIRVEEKTTASSPQNVRKRTGVKTFEIVKEYKNENIQEASAQQNEQMRVNPPLSNPTNLIWDPRTGVKVINVRRSAQNGGVFPFRQNNYFQDNVDEENVSERIDNVENKVDSLSQQLDNLELMAGIYLVGRIFSGLLFNFVSVV